MPQNIPVDPDGRARFRKSLYDEEGDAIALVSVEVVEIDGDEVPEGPDRTPAWLEDGYTTEDEQTGDGPLGKRRYLHLDFAIDTEHASIEKNTSYKIRVTAHDNFNPEKTFDFVYTNGVLDFSTLTGLVTWISGWQAAGGEVLENFGTGGDWALSSGSGFVAAPTFHQRGALQTSGGRYLAPTPALPTSTPFDPWSIFILAQVPNTQVGFFQQADAVAGIRLQRFQSHLRVYLAASGVETSHDTPSNSFPSNSLSLLEVHKASDGTVSFAANGRAGAQVGHAGAVADVPAILGSSIQYFSGYLAEFLVIDGELTEAQKTQIRKALKALYPMSRHEVT